MSTAIQTLAATIVSQMSADDRDGFTVDGWREGVGTMTSTPDEREAVLDAIAGSLPWNHARDACDPGCPGWALFDEGTDREAVQRCDDCDRFEDDDAALRHVAARADAIDRLLLALSDLATRHEGARIEVMPDGAVCFRAEGWITRYGDPHGGGLLASEAKPVPGGGFAVAVAELRKEVLDL